ncbi:CoA transferase [Bosea sp. (in: a-proteobacteria)]|jgi:crotonobetainyl-CoA:carnitine CoA-transferase CaiB-like acyl-CoA transferase|uniref:CaiB/BaiF CoA transferase family protein n=1 Tax=Bosea sp. (in: a-proteobacteria) TaxID=1871050 RepID=UPI001AC7E154|nr:CoA transferase [Bosea sp. (in: a-proteobacteria)]MBN9438304.1 CoA transferase [Bosea sp. (in: a-proteobacteria)]
MPGPLHGIKVVDLTTVIAGPYATQMLGDMGADVLKVEPPGGDVMRGPGPARSPGMGAAFLNANRNKSSITLDLKAERDLAQLRDLIAGADIFIHNMRMGAARKSDLGPDTLLARQSRLIYCAIVGFGQDGPYRDRPAYDDIIQAASGWAALSRHAGDEPRYAPTIVADKTTALFAVGAINAALYHRAVSGEGQAIEVPMFEAMVSFLTVEHLGGRSFEPPLGPSGYSRVLSRNRRPYRTADGYLAVMPYTGAHWRAFFRAAARVDWADEAALDDTAARAAMIDTLYDRLAHCLVERRTAEWLALLAQADIPCSTVNTIDDLLDDPHLGATGFFEKTDHPTEGRLVGTKPPVRFSKTPCSIDKLAPGRNPANT